MTVSLIVSDLVLSQEPGQNLGDESELVGLNNRC